MNNDSNNNTDIILKNNEKLEISKITEKGISLTTTNDFFYDLSEIMTDEKFSKFYDKYFKNMDDIKTTVIYMKLFRAFKDKYDNVSDTELSKYVNIYLLHHAMTNDDIRKNLISATIEHLEDNKKPILEIYDNQNEKINKKINKRLKRKMKKIDDILQ